MNTTDDWREARKEALEEGRRRVGPPPPVEEVEALLAGRLPEAEAREVRETLALSPELVRVMTTPAVEEETPTRVGEWGQAFVRSLGLTRGGNVSEVAILGKRLARSLNRRRRLVVELPEFAVRAIHHRVEETNEGDAEGDQVTFNDVVEWLLITEVTMKRMLVLEQSIPKFTAAMFTWLMDATYQPEEE